jgi:hypothetical protein
MLFMGCGGVEICGYLFGSVFIPIAIGTKAGLGGSLQVKKTCSFYDTSGKHLRQMWRQFANQKDLQLL